MDLEIEKEKEELLKQLDDIIDKSKNNITKTEEIMDECDEIIDFIDTIIRIPKNQDERIIDILLKYASTMENGSSSIYIGENIPEEKLLNAISKFDKNIDFDAVVAICDTSLLNSGKTGYIFTNDKLYSRDFGEKTKSFYYKDIIKINIIKHLNSDNYSDIEFVLKNNNSVLITESHINKTPLKECITEIIAL